VCRTKWGFWQCTLDSLKPCKAAPFFGSLLDAPACIADRSCMDSLAVLAMSSCSTAPRCSTRCCAVMYQFQAPGCRYHSPTLVIRDFGAMRLRPCFSCAAPALPGFFLRAPCGIRDRCHAARGVATVSRYCEELCCLYNANAGLHACSTTACWATEVSAELLQCGSSKGSPMTLGRSQSSCLLGLSPSSSSTWPCTLCWHNRPRLRSFR
jgi:hypothetical protein